MTSMVCATQDHERWKLVEGWWRDQPSIGYSVTPRTKVAYQMRNCSTCGSTLARRVDRAEVIDMEAPEGYWVSAEGYARLAEEMERAGHLDLLKYFERRTMDAAVARFDEVCAAAARLVDVDAVPDEVEPTEDLPAPAPWVESIDDLPAEARP